MKSTLFELFLGLSLLNCFCCLAAEAYCSKLLPPEEKLLCEQVSQARRPESDCADPSFLKKSGPMGMVNCRALRDLAQGGDCTALLNTTEWEASGRCSAIKLGFLVHYADGLSCDSEEVRDSLQAVSALWDKSAGTERAKSLCKLGVFLADYYPSFMKQRRLALHVRTDFDPELARWLDRKIAKANLTGIACQGGEVPLAENILDLLRDANQAIQAFEVQSDSKFHRHIERARKVRTLARSVYEHYRNLGVSLGEGGQIEEPSEEAELAVAFEGVTSGELRKYFNDVVKFIERLRQNEIPLAPGIYRKGSKIPGREAVGPSPIEFELTADGKIRLHIQKVPTERGEVEIKHREGSFKAQYLGIDYDSGELYAVGKVRESIQGESRREVMQTAVKEANKQARLHSPRVARAFASSHDLTGGDFAIIQEYLPYTLSSYPKQPDGFSSEEERNVFLADQLIESLRELEKHKTVHRDIKSENIMVRENPVTGEPESKLIDFGYAKSGAQRSKTLSELTLQGTPRYLSPAAARKSVEPVSQNKSEYRDMRRDPVWDFFAMGVVLYEMAHPELLQDSQGSIEQFFKGLFTVQNYDDLCRVYRICFSDGVKESAGRSPKTLEELAFRLLEPAREHFKMEEVSVWMKNVKHEFDAAPRARLSKSTDREDSPHLVLKELQQEVSRHGRSLKDKTPQQDVVEKLLVDNAETREAEYGMMPNQ